MLFEVNIKQSFADASSFAAFAADFEKFMAKWNSETPKAEWDKLGPMPIDTELEARLDRVREIPGIRSNTNFVSPPSPTFANEKPAASPPTSVTPVPDVGDKLAAVEESTAQTPVAVAPPTPPAATGETIKRTRRTKAEMEAARAAQLQVANGAGASGTSAPVESNHEYTIDDVKAAYSAMCGKLGTKSREASGKLLMDLGVAKFSDIPKEKFALAVDAFNRKASQPDERAKAIGDEIAF